MNRLDNSERLARLLRDSRNASGRSQDYIAKALGVSKKTIQNWEQGLGSPNFRTTFEWFEVLGVPMLPYIMAYLHPREVYKINPQSSFPEIKKALHAYIDELSEDKCRKMLYFHYGDHGSTPAGMQEAVTAYLHLPLSMRIHISANILTAYEIAEAQDKLIQPEHVMPDIEALREYVKAGLRAAKENKNSYTLEEGDK